MDNLILVFIFCLCTGHLWCQGYGSAPDQSLEVQSLVAVAQQDGAVRDIPTDELLARPVVHRFDLSLMGTLTDMVNDLTGRFQTRGGGVHSVIRTQLTRNWGGGVTIANYRGGRRDAFTTRPTDEGFGAYPTSLVGFNVHRKLPIGLGAAALFQFDMCYATQNRIANSGQDFILWREVRGLSPGFSLKCPITFAEKSFGQFNAPQACTYIPMEFKMGLRPVFFAGSISSAVLLEMGLSCKLNQLMR